MKYLVNVFLLLLMTALTVSAQENGKVQRMMEMEQYNKAKSLLKENLKSANTAENWYLLGKVYVKQAKADSARYCFSMIEKADPKSNLVQVGKAITATIDGKNAEALAILDKTRKVASSAKEVETLLAVAETMVMAGDSANWPEVLANVSQIEKKSITPYLVGAKLYSFLADKYNHPLYYGKASGRYEQALYLRPDNEDALTGLSDIYVITRNFSSAEDKLSAVLTADSSYIPALKSLGELSYTLGKYDAASRTFGRYISLAEYSRKDLARYINILYFNKEYAKAGELISSMLADDPSNPVLLRLKGYTSFQLNKDADGLDAMKKFFELRSVVDTNKVIFTDYEYYGRLLGRTGNDSLGVINLTKAYEMDTTQTGLLEDIARMYEKQKKYQPAVDYFGKFVDAKEGNVPSAVYFSMGKDYLVLANQTSGTSDSLLRPVHLIQADTAFSRVVRLSPNSYLGYQWRARVLASLDPETTRGLAKSDYEKTLLVLEQKNDKQKYANDLIEAYRYMGYYYYLRFEEAKKVKDEALKEEAKTNSMSYWQKVLGIDPANDVAKKALAALK